MQGLLEIVVVSAAVRLAGGALRQSEPGWLNRVPGSVFCAIAVWLAGALAGAYAPIWAAAAGGVVAGVACLKTKDWRAGLAADVVVAVIVGLISVPMLSVRNIAALALGVGIVGQGLDRLAVGLSPRIALRTGWGVVGGLCLLVVGYFSLFPIRLSAARNSDGSSPRLLPFLLELGVATMPTGTKVDLPEGGVAWLEFPAYGDRSLGAVFFHGADSGGAQQKAGHILRRAMLSRGFVVLSVDHPGFGSSALPADQTKVESWDPTRVGMAAIHEMEKYVAGDHLVLVGHSMGCTDALQMCAKVPQARGVVLFGAGLPDLTDTNGYWYGRFHQDRRITTRLPFQLIQDIRENYHNNGRTVADLGLQHPPVHFVRFSLEHPAIKATRDALYGKIAGPKRAWDIGPSDHYFNTVELWGLIMGNTGAARACSRLFKDLKVELLHSTGHEVITTKVTDEDTEPKPTGD